MSYLKIKYFLSADCSSLNKKRCEELKTSNTCLKIKGVDTCMCGKEPECDPSGNKPECVDIHGHSEPGDLSAGCKAGK